ncbi:MAG: Spx/MgsR family RNA polymerase-binding regulatory protein [Bacilli bacterium]|nr:Spx/MgsR family RNA polymerase-binding regulatory protein [Bacilli bacterium]
MITVYCYKKCSTCKKALAYLDDNKVVYQLIDLKENRPDEKTLRKIHALTNLPLKRMFNTSGLSYKALDLSKRMDSLSDDEKFALLAQDGMLVKRPLLVLEDLAIPGFKEETWKAALKL